MASIDKIKEILSQFVANGGNVNDLGIKDKVYQEVKAITILNDEGRPYTLNEKFKLAGYPRESKSTKLSEEYLKKTITEYLNEDNSLYENIKKSPWYDSLQSFIKTKYKNTGVKYTTEEMLKRLGFNYFPTYERFKKLFAISEYADKDGYVDDYRKNYNLKHFVNDCGKTLNMPAGYVVELIANGKLKESFINGDYIEETRKEVLEYLQENQTLDGIKRRNIILYNKLRHIQRFAPSGLNQQLDMTEVLYLLGINPGLWNELNNTSDVSNKVVSTEKIISKVIDRAKKSGATYKNGRIQITPADFEPTEYNTIRLAASREGVYITDYLDSRGINYVGGINVNRFSAYKVDKLPNIDKMKADRDKIYNSTTHDKLTKEEDFEVWLSACILAYNKYKQHDTPMELE